MDRIYLNRSFTNLSNKENPILVEKSDRSMNNQEVET